MKSLTSLLSVLVLSLAVLAGCVNVTEDSEREVIMEEEVLVEEVAEEETVTEEDILMEEAISEEEEPVLE